MPYYAGDYYAGDALARIAAGGSALLKAHGPKVLALAKKALPFAGAAAAGAGIEAAVEAATEEGPRRYRRMNVLNPYALRRSMRRVQGFAKFARKTMSFTQRHRMKKRKR